MAIVVNKRPYARNWSGNPIHYTLYSAAAEADPTMWFEYRIHFKRTDQMAFSEIITLPYKPVTGTAKIDIDSILDGLLEYELPYTPDDNEYASPYLAQKATGKFYISYRELTPASGETEWNTAEEANKLDVVKGGISWQKWRGDNYWANYFNPAKPFLTWQTKNSLHSLTERMYLSWLNTTDIYEGDITMKRTVRFTDGSQDVAYLNCPVSKEYIIHFPSGAAQLKIEEINPDKNIYWWELQVFRYNINPEEPLSESYRYYADNRPDYNAITLNYRNSLGGIDSARIRGVIDYTAERSFTQTERIVLHDYFIEHFINGKVQAQNSAELEVFRGDIGHLPKEEQDRLRDIHYIRECWWEQDKKWLPVILLTPSGRLRQSTDKLFSLPIEFAIASGGENYYTPKTVKLNEASETTGLACTAVITDLQWIYTPGTGWILTWTLASGSPAKYQIFTPGVSGGAPGESITTGYIYPWLPVGDNVITVKPICSIGGVLYSGAGISTTITVEPACVPASINTPGEITPFILPDAIEDIAYSYTLPLNGTAPFSLSGITKPGWMTIAISGSAVVFSGTPTSGDVDEDVAIAFTVENCASSELPLSTTIDVLESGDRGQFLATNEMPELSLSLIKKITPVFYSLTGGYIPVSEGMEAEGLLAVPISTPISVFVVVVMPAILTLYKNGAVVENINIAGSGTYTFAATSFALEDDCQIKLHTG